jgi:hypothetical protein
MIFTKICIIVGYGKIYYRWPTYQRLLLDVFGYYGSPFDKPKILKVSLKDNELKWVKQKKMKRRFLQVNKHGNTLLFL